MQEQRSDQRSSTKEFYNDVFFLKSYIQLPCQTSKDDINHKHIWH